MIKNIYDELNESKIRNSEYSKKREISDFIENHHSEINKIRKNKYEEFGNNKELIDYERKSDLIERWNILLRKLFDLIEDEDLESIKLIFNSQLNHREDPDYEACLYYSVRSNIEIFLFFLDSYMLNTKIRYNPEAIDIFKLEKEFNQVGKDEMIKKLIIQLKSLSLSEQHPYSDLPFSPGIPKNIFHIGYIPYKSQRKDEECEFDRNLNQGEYLIGNEIFSHFYNGKYLNLQPKNILPVNQTLFGGEIQWNPMEEKWSPSPKIEKFQGHWEKSEHFEEKSIRERWKTDLKKYNLYFSITNEYRIS